MMWVFIKCYYDELSEWGKKKTSLEDHAQPQTHMGMGKVQDTNAHTRTHRKRKFYMVFRVS